jgi:hypothetical protein
MWQNVIRTLAEGTMTRSIEIPLSEELLRRVDEKAQSAGLERDVYIRAVLSKEVTGELSISEILSSFRDQVAASGTSDEELDRLFRETRDETYQTRNSSKH